MNKFEAWFWLGSLLGVIGFIMILLWIQAHIKIHQSHPSKFYKVMENSIENKTWWYEPVCELKEKNFWICYITFGRKDMGVCIAQFSCYEFTDINYYNCYKFWEVCG